MIGAPGHPRRLAALGLAVVLGLATVACSDDEGGSKEAFCDQVRELDEQGETVDLEDPRGFEEFQALVDDAPDDVREPLETIEAKVSELEGLDEDDPAAFGEAFALVFDPDFLGAVKEFAVYVNDECGVEIEGLEELQQFDPEQLEEELGDLGNLEDFGQELQEGFEDLGEQFEENLGTLVPPTSAPG